MNTSTEKLCENCAGGGSRWLRQPSSDPYEIRRILADSGDGIGEWVKCHYCNGKGFIPTNPLPCQCMECFGDNPYHDPHCEYMLDLTREQPDEKNETIQD